MLERVFSLFGRGSETAATHPPISRAPDTAAIASATDAVLVSLARAQLPARQALLAGSETPAVLAYVAEAVHRVYGFFPGPTAAPAATALLLGHAISPQVAEDTAMIVALAAIGANLTGEPAYVLVETNADVVAFVGTFAPLFAFFEAPLTPLFGSGTIDADRDHRGSTVTTLHELIARLTGDWWKRSIGLPDDLADSIALVTDGTLLLTPAGDRLRNGARSPIDPDTVERAGRLVDRLKEGRDFRVDRRLDVATLTEQGIGVVERRINLDRPADDRFAQFVYQLGQAMLARARYARDRDYAVIGADIVPIDPTSGEPMPGRRLANGLHEALQQREGLPITSVVPVAIATAPAALLGLCARAGVVALDQTTARTITAIGWPAAPAPGVIATGRALSAWMHTDADRRALGMSVEIEAAAKERRPVIGLCWSDESVEQIGALLRERDVVFDRETVAASAGDVIAKAVRVDARPLLWSPGPAPATMRAACSPPPSDERLAALLLVVEAGPGQPDPMLVAALSAPLGVAVSYRFHGVLGEQAANEVAFELPAGSPMEPQPGARMSEAPLGESDTASSGPETGSQAVRGGAGPAHRTDDMATARQARVAGASPLPEATDQPTKPATGGAILAIDTALARVQTRQFDRFNTLRRTIATSDDLTHVTTELARSEIVHLGSIYLPDGGPERWDRAGLLRIVRQLLPKATLPEIRPMRALAAEDRVAPLLGAVQRQAEEIARLPGGAGQLRSLLASLVEAASSQLQGSLDVLAAAQLRAATGDDVNALAARFSGEADVLATAALRQIGHDLLLGLAQLATKEAVPDVPTEPTRRVGPKVGRNDLCPCGSGKKYKRCHGATVAK